MTHFRFRKTAYRLVGVVLLCATHIGVAESNEYRLRYLDERDGLSHNHITRVVQDATGMVWISTWNGLNRYDGSRFVCFTSEPGDGVALPSDRIRNIELREDGNLLCLVEDRLFLFNTQTCRFEGLDSLSEAEGIRKMQEEHARAIQVKNKEQGAKRQEQGIKILGKDFLKLNFPDEKDNGNSQKIMKLFNRIKAIQSKYFILDYTISTSSLEDVFLDLEESK